jgi:hypothetical protein
MRSWSIRKGSFRLAESRLEVGEWLSVTPVF